MTVERRVFEGDSVVVHTTAIPGDDDSVDDMDDDVATRPRKSTVCFSQYFDGSLFSQSDT